MSYNSEVDPFIIDSNVPVCIGLGAFIPTNPSRRGLAPEMSSAITDAAKFERWHQHLLDLSGENIAAPGAIVDGGRLQPRPPVKFVASSRHADCCPVMLGVYAGGLIAEMRYRANDATPPKIPRMLGAGLNLRSTHQVRRKTTKRDHFI